MTEGTPKPFAEVFASQNMERLRLNPYPGRGIVMGLNKDGSQAVQVYWVMGRSESSRNRVLVLDGNEVKTQPFVEKPGQDNSLIIYTALKEVDGKHIVSNGDQTDSIAEVIRLGGTFRDGIMEREYEPDAPNYTPRISGEYAPLEVKPFTLSVIRKANDKDEPIYGLYPYSQAPGIGRMVHTYTGDGNPLPSYDTPPVPVLLNGSIDEISAAFWDRLNEANRVALVAKGINTETGEVSYSFINKLG